MNKEKLELELKKYNIYINLDKYKEFFNLTEYIENNRLYSEEINGYSNAIKYLKNNDSSLRKSLKIADDYGYTIDNITSIVLASLLKTKHNRESYDKLRNKLKKYYYKKTGEKK